MNSTALAEELVRLFKEQARAVKGYDGTSIVVANSYIAIAESIERLLAIDKTALAAGGKDL